MASEANRELLATNLPILGMKRHKLGMKWPSNWPVRKLLTAGRCFLSLKTRSHFWRVFLLCSVISTGNDT